MREGDECKMKSAMLIGEPALGAFHQSDKINVGILHLDPDAEYPEHCHYAEEIYQAEISMGHNDRGAIGNLTIFQPIAKIRRNNMIHFICQLMRVFLRPKFQSEMKYFFSARETVKCNSFHLICCSQRFWSIRHNFSSIIKTHGCV